jgi:hypothetical protein
MTNEQINTAIAEECGWTWIDEDYTYYGFTCDIPMTRRRWTPPNGGKPTLDIPDYCNDLNAMHEAEKMLTSEQVTSYVDLLEFMNERWATPAFGTAAQRAEAFLRTLGKWEETK